MKNGAPVLFLSSRGSGIRNSYLVVAAQLQRDGLFIYAYNVDGTEVISGEFPKPMIFSGRDSNSFALADLDNDGLMELATISKYGDIYAWDTTIPKNINAPWSMYMSNNAQTRRALNTSVFEHQSLEMIPKNRSVSKGQSFIINFAIRNDEDDTIQNFTLEYQFDPSSLAVIDISSSGQAITELDNTKGRFKIHYDSVESAQIISSTIRFKALKIGTTHIELEDINFTIENEKQSLDGNDVDVVITQ